MPYQQHGFFLKVLRMKLFNAWCQEHQKVYRVNIWHRPNTSTLRHEVQNFEVVVIVQNYDIPKTSQGSQFQRGAIFFDPINQFIILKKFYIENYLFLEFNKKEFWQIENCMYFSFCTVSQIPTHCQLNNIAYRLHAYVSLPWRLYSSIGIFWRLQKDLLRIHC
jgi:hypothetical protein